MLLYIVFQNYNVFAYFLIEKNQASEMKTIVSHICEKHISSHLITHIVGQSLSYHLTAIWSSHSRVELIIYIASSLT